MSKEVVGGVFKVNQYLRLTPSIIYSMPRFTYSSNYAPYWNKDKGKALVPSCLAKGQ